MSLINATKQALSWIETCGDGGSPVAYDLRAAIKEAEKVEPVAQACSDGSIEWYRPSTERFVGPLYAHPPAPEGMVSIELAALRAKVAELRKLLRRIDAITGEHRS